jgi:AmmeMemoRadiSam system protein B
MQTAALMDENFIRMKSLYMFFIFHARMKCIIYMRLRKQCLPVGWYPRTSQEIARFLEKVPHHDAVQSSAVAAVAPHAGWFYSGSLAARAVLSLNHGADTVAILGGHLPGGLRPLLAEEDAAETPLGAMPMDREFRLLLGEALGCTSDRYVDNTVEVLLPMVHYFFPQAQLIWLRLPGELASFEAGREIARIARRLGRNLVVLGSTDLTHYGESYEFSPQGKGPRALDWVRTVNDPGFIAALTAGDPGAILSRAREDRSACSPGAVLGALGFAKESEAENAEVLGYGVSADLHPGGGIPDSFVGYGAFCWNVRG